MNILLVSVDFLPKIGGISLMTHYLALALAAQSHNVVVFAPRYHDDAGSQPADDALNVARGRYEIFWDQRYQQPVKEGAGLTLLADQTVPLLQALHAKHAFDHALVLHFDTYGLATQKFCAAYDVPMSVFVHGTELSSLYNRRTALAHLITRLTKAGPSRRDAMLQTLKSADEVLTNSHFTAQTVRTHTGLRGHAVGCGLSPGFEEMAGIIDADERRTAARAQLTAALPGANDKTIITTVARLTPHKNVRLLIEAVAREPALFALIVGNGPQREELEALARQLGAADRVHFTGMVSEDEKTDYLLASDVFALLSTQQRGGAVEGFGIALLEAIACGAVPVSTGTGGMVDIVRHQETGMITPNDPQKLAEIVMHIANDKPLAKALAAQGKALIKQRYNWQAVALQMTQRWQSA